MRIRIYLLALLAGLLIAGCSLVGGGSPADPISAPSATPPPVQNESQVPAEPTDEPLAGATVSSDVEEQSPPTETAQSEPAALPDQGSIPTGSSALKATDPDTVNLADGDPTLVEFFAFW